jgi:hypothetical protein
MIREFLVKAGNLERDVSERDHIQQACEVAVFMQATRLH